VAGGFVTHRDHCGHEHAEGRKWDRHRGRQFQTRDPCHGRQSDRPGSQGRRRPAASVGRWSTQRTSRRGLVTRPGQGAGGVTTGGKVASPGPWCFEGGGTHTVTWREDTADTAVPPIGAVGARRDSRTSGGCAWFRSRLPDGGGPGQRRSGISWLPWACWPEGRWCGMGRDSRRRRCEKGFSPKRPHPFPTRPGGLASFWPAKPSTVRLKLSKIRSGAELRAERLAALRSRPRAGSRRFAGASVRFVVSGEMIPASEAGRVPRTCHVPGSVDWAPDRDGFAGGRSGRFDLSYGSVPSAASIATARPSHTSGSSGQALALREREIVATEVTERRSHKGGCWGLRRIGGEWWRGTKGQRDGGTEGASGEARACPDVCRDVPMAPNAWGPAAGGQCPRFDLQCPRIPRSYVGTAW
jgi:hypothetical protein